jgi:hypothetical protein
MEHQNYEHFMDALERDSPPDSWSQLLCALWWDAKGNWDQAHELADGLHSEQAYAIHAYLHRKEGDAWNAGYWYRRAGRDFQKKRLEEEFKDLVKQELGKQ